MTEEIVFVAQSFVRMRKQLVPGTARCFSSAIAAEASGRTLAKTAAGVVVFSVQGDRKADLWDEPELIATHGDVPHDVHS